MKETIGRALHFIDGEFREGIAGKSFPTLNPVTNEEITQVAEGFAEDIDAAVKAAHRAFHEGPWHDMKAKERAQILLRIADLIERHGEELAYRETLDTGLPIKQTRGQTARAADNFRFFAEMTTRMTGETYPVDESFLNYTIRRPVGVAGLITPWNTPLMLATWKIAPCLATGNTAVLKPAEWSPLTATKLAEIIAEAGVPKGVFNVVHGFGETAGAALVAHPLVQLISFTGETTTGQEIIRNGATTLKRFSMELGGKSPVIVFADADLDRAVDAVIFGVFSLNGERCTAGSRLFVERSIREQFESKLAQRVQKIRVGDPFDEATEVGPLIHRNHYLRVQEYIRMGEEEGAKAVVGGLSPTDQQGNFVQPTLFVDTKNDMRIAQEEIFGPVLVSIPFDTEEEAVRLANQIRYGLAAYVWTRDLQRAHRISHAVESGMVWINSQNVRDLRTPFGGSKMSGIGREGGHYSFEFYTELKTVHVALGDHHIPKFGN
ncbi:5-carboxymethyl-2-hydroxymuconate semialdehyde dehydrogenase [Sulfoacidibacillus thermotolerans]|uniref:5-carboxymethyl-2-hydroxymuconate semialdehyde dehydrogenase n=1 Tax=Sulfoacidibacillus thermotolerans TaxID=1765684 RepID=A0A2U3D875_SULT2|nr:5-carboxymethyl-2-hydroxymuconate semialdehyde dehydrogenase [Sulfoacidibacillus thermotolerans]PWI57483.1 5-carboxymethyl-2-hydroxymuconate semialdehyde dehydrogenase [Sulfoacidibacillus thermotolerans]